MQNYILIILFKDSIQKNFFIFDVKYIGYRSMKNKKHIIIPAALLIYLGVMAYFTYPGTNNPELSLTQYWVTVGITLVIIIALTFFIKKKEDNKKKWDK